MRNITESISKSLETYVKMINLYPALRCELEEMLRDEIANAR